MRWLIAIAVFAGSARADVSVGDAPTAGSSGIIAELIAASITGRTFVEVDYPRGGIKLSSEDLQRATAYIEGHADYRSYHLLLAVRKSAPAAYQRLPPTTRANVLCGALGHLVFFNDWGHLVDGPANGPPAAALVEAGAPALVCLEPFLDDVRGAPFFGSEDATLGSVYRRADFAYSCAARILGERPQFVYSEAARGRAIARLKTKVSGARGKTSVEVDDERLLAAIKEAVLARTPPEQVEARVGHRATINTRRAGERAVLAHASIIDDHGGAVSLSGARDVVYWVRQVPARNPRLAGVIWRADGTPELFFGAILPPR
jgi:hypothetical protein